MDLGDQGNEEDDHDLSEAIERSLQTFDQEGDEGKGKGKAADVAQRESRSDINDPDLEVVPRGTCRSGGIVGSGRAHLRTQYDAGGLMPAEQTRHRSRPDPEEEELAEAMAQSRELFEQDRGAGELATAAGEGPSRCMSRSRKVRRIVEDSDDDQ